MYVYISWMRERVIVIPLACLVLHTQHKMVFLRMFAHFTVLAIVAAAAVGQETQSPADVAPDVQEAPPTEPTRTAQSPAQTTTRATSPSTRTPITTPTLPQPSTTPTLPQPSTTPPLPQPTTTTTQATPTTLGSTPPPLPDRQLFLACYPRWPVRVLDPNCMGDTHKWAAHDVVGRVRGAAKCMPVISGHTIGLHVSNNGQAYMNACLPLSKVRPADDANAFTFSSQDYPVAWFQVKVPSTFIEQQPRILGWTEEEMRAMLDHCTSVPRDVCPGSRYMPFNLLPPTTTQPTNSGSGSAGRKRSVPWLIIGAVSICILGVCPLVGYALYHCFAYRYKF